MLLPKYPVPIIGSTGVYGFSSPLTSKATEVLECTGVRTISDYVANNDDPFVVAYQENGLTLADYESDAALNLEIVTFRNDGGFIYHIPSRYIASFPIQDGILYRGVSFVCSVPAMMVKKDMTTVENEIKAAITRTLGVESVVSLVDTTDVQPVSPNDSVLVETERSIAMGNDIDIYARYTEILNENDSLRERIMLLENFVVSNNL